MTKESDMATTATAPTTTSTPTLRRRLSSFLRRLTLRFARRIIRRYGFEVRVKGTPLNPLELAASIQRLNDLNLRRRVSGLKTREQETLCRGYASACSDLLKLVERMAEVAAKREKGAGDG